MQIITRTFCYLVLSITSIVCFGQDKGEAISAGWGKLDYSIPEAPAFKILGSNPSTIMRPTSTREIAVSLGNYYLNSGPVLPKNLAVEISPSLLSNSLNLKRYNDHKFFYRSRLSLGTNVKDNGSYDLSVGFHFTFIDETDIRTDKNSLDSFYAITNLNLSFKDEVRIRVAKNKSILLSDVDEILSNQSHARYKELREEEESVKGTLISETDNSLYSHIPNVEKIRKSFKENSWNKKIIQLGIAGLFPSKDSLAKNLSGLSNAGIWFSAGLPSGKNGQWLLGARILGTEKYNDKLSQWDISAGTRYYYGKNTTKAFLETEAIIKDSNFDMFSYTINIGGEFNLFNGLWIDFAFGVSKENNKKAEFIPSINLKLGTPEKK